VETPAVERAGDLAAVDAAAVPEVRPEVGAESVHHVRRARGVPPRDEVPVPVVQGTGLFGDLLRVGHAEPPERNRERVSGKRRGRHGAHRLKTFTAFSRRNFGHTWSRNGTSGSSRKIRSSDSPIGK